jgi:hypothetical protein
VELPSGAENRALWAEPVESEVDSVGKGYGLYRHLDPAIVIFARFQRTLTHSARGRELRLISQTNAVMPTTVAESRTDGVLQDRSS